MATGKTTPLGEPVGDLIILDLEEEGNYVAARPSGTEPKIKLYVFTRLSAEQSQNLKEAKEELVRRIDGLDRDMRAFARLNS